MLELRNNYTQCIATQMMSSYTIIQTKNTVKQFYKGSHLKMFMLGIAQKA